MLTAFAVSNYRSLRSIVLPFARLNVVSGDNGVGKTNLYRSLSLLASAATGSVVSSLAREGGLESPLWAGSPQSRRGPVRLQLGFAAETLSYCIDLGVPIGDANSVFVLDPEIKRECIWTGSTLRPSSLVVDRHNQTIKARNDDDKWHIISHQLHGFDSMLTQVADPRIAPEILTIREYIRSWRFYDHFRTDFESQVRYPQVGTRTPVLSHDGRDIAAALQTIFEIGDGPQLIKSIDDAFPGTVLRIEYSDGRLGIRLQQPGLQRALNASELSDGTLRYLLLVAALLTPRPPPLMVLNEPETSLHPELLPPLGRLIIAASKSSQIWVVSHSKQLISVLEGVVDCNHIRLSKKSGETYMVGQSDLDKPAWNWPSR